VQVKHIASSNYFISSPITGDAVPAAIKHGSGPADVKTKADMLKFLKESFAVGRKAAATLTTRCSRSPGKAPRLDRTEFGVAHAHNHYRQMVEYLRMESFRRQAEKNQTKVELQRRPPAGIFLMEVDEGGPDPPVFQEI